MESTPANISKPAAKGGTPVGVRRQKVLEKNRKAQARFRDKQKQKERDMAAQIETLQRQLQDATIDSTCCKRQNEVLSRVLELRQEQYDVLQRTAQLRDGAASDAAKAVSTPSAAGAGAASGPTLEQCRSMTLKPAAMLWRDLVQSMAMKLVAVEVPQPQADAVAQLSAAAMRAGKFATTIAVVNPEVMKAFASRNLDTLETYARQPCVEWHSQPMWSKAVESLALTEEQRDKIRFLTQRHNDTMAVLDAERQKHHAELERLLPQSLGLDNDAIEACLRTENIMHLIRRNFQSRHESFFTLAATVLGKILNVVQFARFCVNVYPYFPAVRAIVFWVEREATGSVPQVHATPAASLGDSATTSSDFLYSA